MLHAGSAPSGWRGRMWVAGIALTVALVPIHLTARDVPEGAANPVLPAAQAVRATVAVVLPALTGQPVFADQASPRLAAGARFGAKPSRGPKAQQSEPSAHAFLLAERDAAEARVRALRADRDRLRQLASQQGGAGTDTLRALERELARQEENLAMLVARVADAEAAQKAEAESSSERLGRMARAAQAQAEATQARMQTAQARLAQSAQISSNEQLRRDLERLSYSLREVERAQATIKAQTELEESRKTLELLAARQGELARAAAEIQRGLAEKYTEAHPERQQLERQIESMRQQSKALSEAREHLEQQRQHLDQAQRQLEEAEQRLREVLKAMPEPK